MLYNYGSLDSRYHGELDEDVFRTQHRPHHHISQADIVAQLPSHQLVLDGVETIGRKKSDRSIHRRSTLSLRRRLSRKDTVYPPEQKTLPHVSRSAPARDTHIQVLDYVDGEGGYEDENWPEQANVLRDLSGSLSLKRQVK